MLRPMLKLNIDRESVNQIGKGVFLYKNYPTFQVSGQKRPRDKFEEDEEANKPMLYRSYHENRYLLTAPNSEALRVAYKNQLKEQEEKRQQMRNTKLHGVDEKQRKKKEEEQKHMSPPTAKAVIQYLRDMASYMTREEGRKVNVFPLISKSGTIPNESEDEDEDEEEEEQESGKGQNKKLGDMLLLENTKYAHRKYQLEKKLHVQKKGKQSFHTIKKRKKM